MRFFRDSERGAGITVAIDRQLLFPQSEAADRKQPKAISSRQSLDVGVRGGPASP